MDCKHHHHRRALEQEWNNVFNNKFKDDDDVESKEKWRKLFLKLAMEKKWVKLGLLTKIIEKKDMDCKHHRRRAFEQEWNNVFNNTFKDDDVESEEKWKKLFIKLAMEKKFVKLALLTKIIKRKIKNKERHLRLPKMSELLLSVAGICDTIVANGGPTTREFTICRDIEKCLINPPVVSYNNNNKEECLVAAAAVEKLKKPEVIIHHQSCTGLGCSSEECRILRAIYIHLSLFRHRCSVWKSFYNMMTEHSKLCRKLDCGIKFCPFIKHELHQNGVSILPLQLFKERSTVEEEFEKCNKYRHHHHHHHVLRCNHHHHHHHPHPHILASYPKTPLGELVTKLLFRTSDLLKELWGLMPPP